MTSVQIANPYNDAKTEQFPSMVDASCVRRGRCGQRPPRGSRQGIRGENIRLISRSTASDLVPCGNFCDKRVDSGEATVTFGRRLGKDSGVVLELSQSPVEAPDELVRRLTQLQLCRPSDFRRARACVRRLSRDLPAFDSVWIDALVQLRKLTHHQARLLESGAGDQLLIAGYVVVDKLGHGPHGTTLLAKSPGRNDRTVLKRLQIAMEAVPDCRMRLSQFIERSHACSHPNIVVPEQLLDFDQTLVAVSRWVPGLTLKELLVRRGRFPASIVIEIARQLSSGLAALHGHGLVHGDVRLSNVRMTTVGTAVLVDGGVRPAVCPELTIHDTLALDAYDGVAPELIGTGIGASASSEIYALGCLLWQLLTGRPPHSMADPLMKLAAHQTQRIADVRTLAPETPTLLADLIQAMTSPDVNDRPRSFDELLHRCGRPGMSSRSRLKRYRKNFDGAVPHFGRSDGRTTDSRWPWIAVSLFVAAGMALTFADKGLRNEMLSITRRVTDALQSREPTTSGIDTNLTTSSGGRSSETTSVAGGLLPLPSVSADGEIVLAEPGPYDVARITTGGNLKIRGVQGVNPVIQIGREPLWLEANAITLENVSLICDRPEDQSPKSMLLAKSQQLVIQGCLFQRVLPTDDPVKSNEADLDHSVRHSGPNFPAIAWGPLIPGQSNSHSWQLDVRNSIFRAPGSAVWFAELPHQVSFSNCLKVGDGACFTVSARASAHDCAFELNRLTLRDTGPLLRLAGLFAEQARVPTIEFKANDCIFAHASSSSGLIELQTAHPRSDASRAIHTDGRGSVVVPGVKLLVAVDTDAREPTRQSVREIADADEQFEGIMVVTDLKFGGPAAGATANSRLEKLTPRSTGDALPGIDVSRLPAIRLKK